MIVTVTLNPTLDKTLSVPALRPGEVHRARFLRQDIGGKGINVSRALRCPGRGEHPDRLPGRRHGSGDARRACTAQGYDARFVEVPGETRQNLTLLDETTGVYTKINEPGPTIGPEHLAALHALVAELAAPGDLWALCGSLPPGAPAGLYADLITAVQARGAAAILDTSEDGAAPWAGGAAGRHQAQQRGSGPGFGSAGVQRRGARGRGAPPVRSPGPGDASRARGVPDARRARAAAGRRRRAGDG